MFVAALGVLLMTVPSCSVVAAAMTEQVDGALVRQ